MSPDEQHKGETGSLDDIFNNIDDFSNNKPKISSKDRYAELPALVVSN